MKMLEMNDLMLAFYVIQWVYALYLIFQGVPKPSRTAFYLRAHRH